VQIFSVLLMGGKITLLQDITELNKLSEKQQFTILITTPSILENYLKIFNLPDSLKVLGTTGELMSQSLSRKIFKEYTHLKKCIIYGPTEASIFSTTYQY
ncbi:AMP-binding protein, partial [Geminocystis sp. GBBB08]|uniref:AMP-binding protein n=1 Tax=Geminocystis sp. GBBB08 TaxID=2604140 RepID=UPI0027E2C646